MCIRDRYNIYNDIVIGILKTIRHIIKVLAQGFLQKGDSQLVYTDCGCKMT